MRILALETSSRRGSAALLDRGALVGLAAHEEPNAHGERMLGLVDALLAEAGWAPRDLERIAVGTGPGSFTGLRVGLSLGQGMALGLGVPAVGVGSLAALAAAAVDSLGLRCALTDARRGEVFVAVYDANGRERVAPVALPREGFLDALARLGLTNQERAALTFLGEPAVELGLTTADEPTRLPSAEWVARLGASRESPAEPTYAREPDATLPRPRGA